MGLRPSIVFDIRTECLYVSAARLCQLGVRMLCCKLLLMKSLMFLGVKLHYKGNFSHKTCPSRYNDRTIRDRIAYLAAGATTARLAERPSLSFYAVLPVLDAIRHSYRHIGTRSVQDWRDLLGLHVPLLCFPLSDVARCRGHWPRWSSMLLLARNRN